MILRVVSSTSTLVFFLAPIIPTRHSRSFLTDVAYVIYRSRIWMALILEQLSRGYRGGHVRLVHRPAYGVHFYHLDTAHRHVPLVQIFDEGDMRGVSLQSTVRY